MIRVSNLKKTYIIDGKEFHAIDDVTFRVRQGEVYGIIGLSGAGKSTLIRCLNRLEEADSGRIEIDGLDIVSLRGKDLLAMRKNMAMIFQHFNLFNRMTLEENVAYTLKLAKWPRAEISKRVEEMLEFVELGDRKNSYPSDLSGGQKQRVAIARALASRPKILLCDEATSALDPNTTKDICQLIKRSAQHYGTTVILITHQMEVAKSICDRIAVMNAGKIVEENKTEDLFRNPKDKVTKSFIEGISIANDNDYQNYQAKGRLVRLSFDSRTAETPVMSQLSKKFDLDVNILSGNINKLENTSVGYLIVDFIGEKDEVDRALEFCRAQGLIWEVLNV